MYLRRRHVKRLVSFLLAAALMMTVPAYAYDAPSGEVGLSNVAHVYAVKPGTDEWVYMSVEQRLASCRVTQAEVEAMTTEALIETIVNYPYLVNIFAYDTIEMGIEMVSNHFPGIEELFERADCQSELSKFINKVGVFSSSKEEILKRIYALELMETVSKKLPTRMGREPRSWKTRGEEGNTVYAVYLRDWESLGGTAAYYNEMDDQFQLTYPNAERLYPITALFNCHSYAWHITATDNQYWIDDCTPYVTDDEYCVVSSSFVGAKVTYSPAGQQGNYIHSGVVTSKVGSNVTVTSKWGACGLYRHALNDCPYLVDQNEAGNVISFGFVQYWRVL
ncbi:MAG: hypothetical protein IKM51_03005 [Oscillospiraceae bacterium]|nr:hypothetical protein [Oscillospiraceae bacterium]